MISRVRLVTGLLLVLLACDDNSTTKDTTPTSITSTTTSTSTTSTTTTTVPTSTATTATPTTTIDSSSTTEVATTDGTAELDWLALVQTLGLRIQQLYSAPDVSRIGEVCATQSTCADQLNVQLGDLASKGWHVAGGDPYTVVEAHVEKFDGSSPETSFLVTVIAVVQRPDDGGTIVDSSGTKVADVVSDTPKGMNTQYRFILARLGPDNDPWRISSQEKLREVPA